MKKSLAAILFLSIVFTSLDSCKKGDNDPFFTIHSRKARLSGQWKVITLEIKEAWNDTIVHWSLKDGVIDVTLNGIDWGSYSFDETLTIKKDGSFEWFYNEGGYRFNGLGSWYFAGKSKSADLKNKEAVVFAYRERNFNPGNNYSYVGLQSNVTYHIDELRKKSMTLMYDKSSYYSNDVPYTRSELLRYESSD